MPTEESSLDSLPKGLKFRPDGTAYYAGASAPVSPSARPLPRDFDERMRRYYGEDMRGSYNPINPIVRGVKQGFVGEVSGATGFGEILSGSETLKGWADDLEKTSAGIPMRSASRDIYDEGRWTGLKNPTEALGFAGEVFGSLVGQFAPYVAGVLIPEPTTTVAGAGGAIVKAGSLVGKVSKALGFAGKTKAQKFARAATYGMPATMAGRQFRETRDVLGVENRPLALVSGAAQGYLNKLPIDRLLKSKTGKNYYTDIIKSMFALGATEGVTEVMQESIQLGTNELASHIADKTYHLANSNNLLRLIDAGVAGVVGGGMAGGLGAASNYVNDPLSLEDDKRLFDEAFALTGKDSDTVRRKAKRATYNGLVSSLSNSLKNPERLFSTAEVDVYRRMLESVNALDLPDKEKKSISNRLSPLVEAAALRRAAGVDDKDEEEELKTPETVAAEATVTAAKDLVKTAEGNLGITPELKQEEAAEQSLQSQRQALINDASRNMSIILPANLAPYNTVGQGLQYSIGTRFIHTFRQQDGKVNEVIAEITEVNGETGLPSQAVWNGYVVLDTVNNEPVGLHTSDDMVAASERPFARVQRDPNEVNETVYQVRQEADIKRKAAEEAKKPKGSKAVAKPEDTVPIGKYMFAQGVGKLREREGWAAERPGGPREIEETAGSRVSGLAKATAGLRQNLEAARKKDEDEAAKKEIKSMPLRGAKKKAKPAVRKQKPKTKEQEAVTADLEELRTKQKAADDRADVLFKAAGRELKGTIKTQGKSPMMLFLPPLDFEKLGGFLSKLSQGISQKIISAWYGFLIRAKESKMSRSEIKRYVPPQTKVIKEALNLYRPLAEQAARDFAALSGAEPKQVLAITEAFEAYFEDKVKNLKKSGIKWNDIVGKDGDINPDFVKWLNVFEEVDVYETKNILKPIAYGEKNKPEVGGEARQERKLIGTRLDYTREFIDWVHKNYIQLPSDEVAKDTVTLVNADKTKNLTFLSDHSELSSSVIIEGPSWEKSAAKLRHKNGAKSDAYLSLSVRNKKKIVSIKATNSKGEMVVVYQLKAKEANAIKADPAHDGGVAFVYLPNEYVWGSDGMFNSQHWERVNKNSPWRFSSDLPHTSLGRGELQLQLAGAMNMLGSTDIARELKRQGKESAYEFPLEKLEGYIAFAKKHHTYDSKKWKTENIFEDAYFAEDIAKLKAAVEAGDITESKAKKEAAKLRSLELGRMTTTQLAKALRASIRALASRALQDYNRSLEGAKGVMEDVSDELKGRGEYRLFRDDPTYQRVFVERKDVDGNDIKHWTSWAGEKEVKTPLVSDLDYFRFYIDVLKRQIEAGERKLRDESYTDSVKHDIRTKDLVNYRKYLAHAEKSLGRVQVKAFKLKREKSEEDQEEASDGNLKTVGGMPSEIDAGIHKRMASITEYLRKKAGDTGYARLEAVAFSHTQSIYDKPIESESEAFKENFKSLYDEGYADKVLTQESAEENVTPSWTEPGEVSGEGSPIAAEGETLGAKDTITDDEMKLPVREASEYHRYLQQELGDISKHYNDFMGSPDEDFIIKLSGDGDVSEAAANIKNAIDRYGVSFELLDRHNNLTELNDKGEFGTLKELKIPRSEMLEYINSMMVVSYDEVGREVFDSKTSDGLLSGVVGTSQSLISALDDILKSSNVLSSDKDRNDGNALIKFLKLLEVPKVPPTKPIIKAQKEKARKLRDELIDEIFSSDRQSVRDVYKQFENSPVAREAIRDIFDIEFSEGADLDDGGVNANSTLAEGFSFQDAFEGLSDAEIRSKRDRYGKLYYKKVDDFLYSKLTAAEKGAHTNHKKAKDAHDDLISVMAAFYNTTRKGMLVDYINRSFRYDPKKMSQKESVAFLKKLAKNVGFLKEIIEGELKQKGGVGILMNQLSTPFAVADNSGNLESMATAASKINKQRTYFARHFRALREGQRFRGLSRSRDLFTNLMKLSIEYNEQVIVSLESDYRKDNKSVSDEQIPYYLFHGFEKIRGKQQSAFDLFTKFKALVEAKDNVSDLITDSSFWNKESRIFDKDNPASVDEWILSMTEFAESQADDARNGAQYRELEAAQGADVAEETIKEFHKPNRVIRRALLKFIAEDLIVLVRKQSASTSTFFRNQLGITRSVVDQMVKEIDEVFEGSEGAYGKLPSWQKSPFGRRVNEVREGGAFEGFPELFELRTVRGAVPRAFLHRQSGAERVTHRSGRVHQTGKFTSAPPSARVEGMPLELVEEGDYYRPMVSVTGADGIRGALNDYYYALPEGTAQQGLDLLDSIPEKFFDEMDFEISEDIVSGGVRLAGAFENLSGRLRAAVNLTHQKDGDTTDVVAHELAHSLFSFLSKAEIKQISNLRKEALRKLARGMGSDHQKIVATKMIDQFGGNMTTIEFGQKMEGTTVSGFAEALDSVYPLINDSEYFAYLLTNKGRVTQFDTMPAAQKGFLSKVFEKVRQIFKSLLGYIKSGDQLRADILRKFNDGTFSHRVSEVPEGVHGQYERLSEVKRAMETDYIEGRNPEAGERIAMESSAPSKMLEGLILKEMEKLSMDERYSGQLLDDDGKLDPNKTVASWSHLKRNKEINQYLSEAATVNGEEALNPEAYLELFERQGELDESTWKQVSRNTALSLEYFIEAYQFQKTNLEEKLEGEKAKKEIQKLFETASKAYVDESHHGETARSAETQAKELMEQARANDMRGKAADLLEGFGFTLTELNSQLNERTYGELPDIIRKMYDVLYSTNEGRVALIGGRNSKGGELKSGESLAKLYEKIEMERYAIKTGNVAMISVPKTEGVSSGPKAAIDPTAKARSEFRREFLKNTGFKVSNMHNLAAWHLFNIHKIDREQLKLVEEFDEEFASAHNDYYLELSELASKGDDAALQKAVEKLFNDMKKGLREEGKHAALYLSTKKTLQSRLNKVSDARLAVEILERVKDSDVFIEARSKSSAVVGMRPAREIRHEGANMELPVPGGDGIVKISMDVGTSKKLDSQLRELDQYIADVNEWIQTNYPVGAKDDVHRVFWEEMRDLASALMASNTVRAGQVSQKMKGDFLKQKFKPLESVLADIGGYPTRISRHELGNYVEASELSEDWRRKNEELMMSKLYDAAESHGYPADSIGISQWYQDIGQEYFAYANKVGLMMEVGDALYIRGEAHKITIEDNRALENQTVNIGKGLYGININISRGDIATRRNISDRVSGGKKAKEMYRDPIPATEATLPKTFNWSGVLFAQKVSDAHTSIMDSLDEADIADLPDDIARGIKLSVIKEAEFNGKTIYGLISNEFDRFVKAFLGDRGGKITAGTNPYFKRESIYADAKREMDMGRIRNMQELGVYFAKRSVDLNKLDPEDEKDYSLTAEGAEYELVREMLNQILSLNKKLNPRGKEGDVDTGASNEIRVVVLKDKNSFNTAREAPVANWFFYNYGIHGTTGLSKLVSDSSSQYLDRFVQSLDGVTSYLAGARKDMEDLTVVQARKGEFDGTILVKKDQLELDLNKIQSLKNELEKLQNRDVRFEQLINRGAVQVGLRDMVALALQSIVTGVRNLLGTPLRTQLRLQVIFGMSPRMHVSGAVNILKGMVQGAGTLAYGVTTGAFSGGWTLLAGDKKGRRVRPAIMKFMEKAFDEPWVKEVSIGQFKINETFAHIASLGYGIRSDSATKFDNWWRNPETRGRIEREDEIKGRRETLKGKALSKLINIWNKGAFFGMEFFGSVGPRMFDMTGNNISFRQANVAARILDARLKKLHADYGKSLFEDIFNDPTSLDRGNPLDALKPEHVFGGGFLFKATNNQLKILEDLFSQAGLDFHREALMFLKELDTNKEAEFLSEDSLSKLGVALFSENASTLASRSLEFRNDPTKNMMFQLFGWGLSAYYNSLSWLGRSIKGNPKWASREGVRFQQAVAMMGFLTLSAGGTAATEEIIRRLKMLLFDEVANNRHPWEEDEEWAQTKRWGVYAMAAFPIMNIPANILLSDTGSTTAAGGVDLFYQSAIKRSFTFIKGMGDTWQFFPPYQWDMWVKSTMPNPAIRMVVNSIAGGHVDHINNKRLLQMFADPAYRKPSAGFYSGISSNPVSAHVRNMVNYSVSGEFDLFTGEVRKAVSAAVEMEKEDPLQYVRGLYWARDPYRQGLRGTPTLSLRNRVLEKIEEGYGKDMKDKFLETEANFNNGYRLLGGVPNRISVPKLPVTTRKATTRRTRTNRGSSRVGEANYGRTMKTLRRAYGV